MSDRRFEGFIVALMSKISGGIRQFSIRIDVKAIVFIVLMLHLFAMSFPRDAYVFDEIFYVPAARDLLRAEPSNLEHPFLGKLWAAIGIALFGDNWFGWRILYVIIGTSSLYLFYLLSKLFLTEKYSLYTTALLGFETLFFVHSNLALLDVPSIFFGLLAFYLFFKGKLLWSATALGLSILNKETGILFLFVLVIYEASKIQELCKVRDFIGKLSKAAIFLLVILLVFLTPMTLYDVIYKPEQGMIRNGLDHIGFMARYASALTIDEVNIYTNLTTTHLELYDQYGKHVANITTDNEGRFFVNGPFSLKLDKGNYTWKGDAASGTFSIPYGISGGNFAWNWIVPSNNPYGVAPYYVLSVNRTNFTAEDPSSETQYEVVHPIIWFGVGTLPIWWSIWLIVPLVAENVIRKPESRIDRFLLAWISGTCIPFLVLSLVFRRIVYPFYFLTTVPALCLGIPHLVTESVNSRTLREWLLYAFMLLVLLFFFVHFPVRILEQ